MEYPIPKAACAAFRAHMNKKPQNAGLIFDRYAPDWRKDPKLKQEGLEVVRRAAENADDRLLIAWNARWNESVRAAGAVPFSMKTDWRFVAGLGRKGPLEVGFAFHRYGFPILPGSSVKGIARAYASLYLGKDEKDEEFLAIFGCAPQGSEDETGAQCGGAIFFDAIPASLPKLDMDIMNPHFPDYYQDKSGKTPPTDSQSPVPVYFLTVAPGTEFHFAVGWRGMLDDESKKLRNKAEEWLRKGLMELGAGAKTSAGYGYFVELPGGRADSKNAAAASVPVTPSEPAESALARQIRSIPQSQIKSSIGNYVRQWQALPHGPDRLEAAQALREKITEGGILKDKKWRDKDWVKEVLDYLEKHDNQQTENEE